MVISLLLSDEYILGLIGSGMTIMFVIGFAIAFFLALKTNPVYRTIGFVLAWVLALTSAPLWDSGGSVSFFVLVSPLLFLLYKAFAWLFKWGK
jgi:hypothetical protein